MEKKTAQQTEQKKPDQIRPEEEQVKELSGEDVEKVTGGMNKIPEDQWPEYQAPSGNFL